MCEYERRGVETVDGEIQVGETRIVNKKAHSGDGIYIGRENRGDKHLLNSKPGECFGSPHPVTEIKKAEGVSEEEARRISIDRFESDLKELLAQEDDAWREAVASLHGETLVCWCAPQDCHGRVLAEWAERIVEWNRD